jgi:hypothetical protein
MNKVYFTIFIIQFLVFNSFCQSYLGYVNNGCELIDTNNRQIKHIPKGDAVFIISLDLQFGHYNVVHIKSSKEGFLPRKNIIIERVIPQTESNVFNSIKKSDIKNPILKIMNSSKYAMILKIDNNFYEINPKEKKAIHLTKGRHYYRVSSPYMEPYYGTEILDEFHLYEWEFYIADM